MATGVVLDTWEILQRETMRRQYYHIARLGDTVFLNGQPTDDPEILEMAGVQPDQMREGESCQQK